VVVVKPSGVVMPIRSKGGECQLQQEHGAAKDETRQKEK
jgi:hypothetical protein